MFDRFIRLARAKKALHEQRYLDALQQASDPLIEDHRRAERIRVAATEQLIRRVRSRLDAGDVSTAQQEVQRLRQLVKTEALSELVGVVDEAVTLRTRAQDNRRELTREFRHLVDIGDLAAAESLLAGVDKADRAMRSLTDLLASRRSASMLALNRAVSDAGSGSPRSAIDGYVQALAMDSGLPGAVRSAALREIATAAALDVESSTTIATATVTQLGPVLSAYSLWVRKLPALEDESAMISLRAQLVEAIVRCFQSVDSLSAAVDLSRAVSSSGLPVQAELDRVIADLLTVAESDGGHPPTVVLAQLQEDARCAGFAKVMELAGFQLASLTQGEEQLELGRSLLVQGKLEAARAMFVGFQKENPMHEGVHRELELVDQGMADLDRGLADVRLALRSGRLREACAGAMSLVGVSRIAAEAQQMLGEARSRMSLVDRGLDEVRVLLHSRAAATSEGVNHCLKRLEELQKVQVDHEELPRVIEAVSAEIKGLALCEKTVDDLSRSDIDAVVTAVPELIAVRMDLLGVERLDAKLCQLGDGVIQFGDRALSDGRLLVMLRCSGVLDHLGPIRGDFATRASEWRQVHDQREIKVGELLREARLRLADRDLAEAERLVEEAQGHWRESAEVQAFAHQLQKLRKQAHTLDQVAELAEDKDFLGAHQKLASIPNVPPMLRTRVFDMKQDLARAQGLEGSFMLRVDEGGEQLVMRGETVSIGNVRKASADLPVLASLAARHATIRRTMSFHGGMQDVVVAEDGEVKVGGKKVTRHALKSGDRVSLGAALKLLYQKPTERSLTSRLLLQSGFQVGGTDRVLLMKDRGRDGRILIGPGRDVHVTVAKATGEIELFANNAGQMRVFCEQGGTIGGAVFRGEHPVAAGQVIEACGITFLLLPWQSTA